MWVISTTGIYSIVGHFTDPHQLLVRSRAEKDIDTFYKEFTELGFTPYSGTELAEKFQKDAEESGKIYLANADYPYRFFCDKAQVGEWMAQLTEAIDYPNFKAAAPKERSSVYFKIYNAIFAIDERKKVKAWGTDYHSPITSTVSKPSKKDEEQWLEDIEELEIGLELCADVAEKPGVQLPSTVKRKILTVVKKYLHGSEPAEGSREAKELKELEDGNV